MTDIKEMLEKLVKELETATNPELKHYYEKCKEMLDGMRKEEKEEGEVTSERRGRIVEAACDMQAVSK